MKGIDPEDASKVEGLILQTLEKLAQEGLEPEMMEAAVNTIEFSLRENNTGNFPRGLNLMIRAIRTWIHDGDPLTAHELSERERRLVRHRSGVRLLPGQGLRQGREIGPIGRQPGVAPRTSA